MKNQDKIEAVKKYLQENFPECINIEDGIVKNSEDPKFIVIREKPPRYVLSFDGKEWEDYSPSKIINILEKWNTPKFLRENAEFRVSISENNLPILETKGE
ncbi:TPA: hypothetical protein DE059_01790 [Candidatus Peribacteria bacterium]|jgi:hypothetical protein|nr:hypothetical protein [Candidatus Peribacteria bacterium]|tara:strand:- start:824 stop:1126 length:303 start_codon:yes stop_codon:yes gene_type:complete